LTSRRPEPLVLFLDESLDSDSIAQALSDAGAKVERLTNHLPRGTTDEEWLALAGRNGWVVLTRDKRIRYRRLERLALEAAKVRAFVFTGGNVS
jgi:predicted nuclease of predicted toxin-antitoxin system